MVERMRPVSPANFLYNMVKIFTNTGNALTPSRLRTPCAAQHESTGFCGWVSSTGQEPVHIPNWKGASPYPQLEMGWSISPTRKGPCKRHGLWAPCQKWPKKMPGTLTLPSK